MARWSEIEAAEPELASTARGLLEAMTHLTLATLRADGSPRISGTEIEFAGGDIWLGMMPGSRKLADLRREPRSALHSGSPDPPDWPGDAKLDAIATVVDDAEEMTAFLDVLGDVPPGPFSAARLDIRRLVVTEIGDPADHLVITWWTPEGGLRRTQR